MNKHIVHTLFYLLFISLFLSCTHSKKLEQLKIAQDIMYKDPARAGRLLDSIGDPSQLEQDVYMQYIVANTQARYLTGLNIANDSLILEAQAYFDEQSDPNQKALTNLYAGLYYTQRGEDKNALVNYRKAEKNALEGRDLLLASKANHNIGYLYFSQELQDSAMVYYQKALNNYRKEKDTGNYQLQELTSIGGAYLENIKLDSAKVYFQKTQLLAQQIDNANYEGFALNNLGLVYLEQKDYKKASDYLYKSLKYPKTVQDSIRTYLNLSRIYNATNKLDSASYYTKWINARISQIKDVSTLSAVYQALADYNAKADNTKEAVKYAKLHEQVEKQIMERNQAQDLRNARAEADQEHTSKIFFLVTAVCLLATLGVLTVYGRKRVRELRQSKDEWVTRLVETEVRLTKQNLETQDEVRKQNLNTLKVQQVGHTKYFDHWHKIDKEVKSLGYKLGTSEEPTIYKRIVDMEEDSRTELIEKGIEWVKDYIALNLPNGEKAVSTMTDKELIMFMLCFCRYTHKQMAIFLNVAYNKNNINMRKLDVRNKLKWAGVPSDLCEELIFGQIPLIPQLENESVDT